MTLQGWVDFTAACREEKRRAAVFVQTRIRSWLAKRMVQAERDREARRLRLMRQGLGRHNDALCLFCWHGWQKYVGMCREDKDGAALVMQGGFRMLKAKREVAGVRAERERKEAIIAKNIKRLQMKLEYRVFRAWHWLMDEAKNNLAAQVMQSKYRCHRAQMERNARQARKDYIEKHVLMALGRQHERLLSHTYTAWVFAVLMTKSANMLQRRWRIKMVRLG